MLGARAPRRSPSAAGSRSSRPGRRCATPSRVADAAQYSAKRRGALLFVAGPESTDGGPRRRFRDRPESRRRPPRRPTCSSSRPGPSRACARTSSTPRRRFVAVWSGWPSVCCTGLELDHWTLSTVDLAGDRVLTVTSMGLRAGRSPEDADADLLIDTALPLSDYPLSDCAVVGNGWFTIDVQDDEADPAERAVLTALGKRYLVAIGWSVGAQGLLLEVYGRGERDVELLGATAALAAGALLGARYSGSRARRCRSDAGRLPAGRPSACRREPRSAKMTACRTPAPASPPGPTTSSTVDLVSEYYTREPDLDDPAQRVVFGTSGHRGSSLTRVQRGAHPGDHARRSASTAPRRASTGRCSSARTRTRCPSPPGGRRWRCSRRTTSTVLVDARDGYTPTPAVSHAILRHNRGRRRARPGRRHRGHAVAQPARATAASSTTRRTAARPTPTRPAGSRTAPTTLLRAGCRDVRRVPSSGARGDAAPLRLHGAVRRRPAQRRRPRRDPRRPACASAPTRWAARASTTGARSPSGTGSTSPWSTRTVDPTWRFMTLDWDGKIRMDCSSPSPWRRLDRAAADRLRHRHRQRRRQPTGTASSRPTPA